MVWLGVQVVEFLETIDVGFEHGIYRVAPEFSVPEGLPSLELKVRLDLVVDQVLDRLCECLVYACLDVFKVTDPDKELQELTANEAAFILDVSFLLRISRDEEEVVMCCLEDVVKQVTSLAKD